MNTTVYALRPATFAVTTPIAADWLARAQAWIARQAMDPRTRYLSEARDHADLERRVEQWEAGQRRAATFAPLV